MEPRALAFDVFGTVVDWRASVIEEVAAVAARYGAHGHWGAFADAWRRRYQPSLELVRSGAIAWTPLDDLHRTSLEEVLREFGLPMLVEEDRQGLNLAWHRLRPWADSVEGLRLLRSRYILTTLSNGNVALLVDLARNGGLPFDCILSAELCRAYKPDPKTYRMVPELLRIRPEQAMMVAAHRDDLLAARACGLRTAFVRRPDEWGPGGQAEPPPAEVDVVAHDFLDLARQLGAGAAPREG